MGQGLQRKFLKHLVVDLNPESSDVGFFFSNSFFPQLSLVVVFFSLLMFLILAFVLL